MTQNLRRNLSLKARIEGFLNLSGKEVVEKRKRVMMVGDKLDSTKKKLKK